VDGHNYDFVTYDSIIRITGAFFMTARIQISDAARILTETEIACVGGATRGSIMPPLNPPASQLPYKTIERSCSVDGCWYVIEFW
jgi:hypothetical protein